MANQNYVSSGRWTQPIGTMAAGPAPPLGRTALELMQQLLIPYSTKKPAVRIW
jgi:hypothetical protein